MNKKMTKISDVIGPAYYDVFCDLEEKQHLHYWFTGGRGSLKSSFVFIYIIYSMTRDYSNGDVSHCVALRKVKDTVFDSLYQNFLWAIDLLGVSDLWSGTTSPMKLRIGENTILFRGCKDRKDYQKIKSIKFSKGACRYGVFEELTEFDGMDEIIQILASLFRNTDVAQCFYMYNPPISKHNWVNVEVKVKDDSRYVHKSTYLSAPPEWLGKIFIEEANKIKRLNYRKYKHVYLGASIGEGLEIYKNVINRTISDKEIETFDNLHRGVDFGFTQDASCYVECYYDEKNLRLYIIDEVYGHGIKNKMLYALIYPKSTYNLIRGDSAEPRTISELRDLGLNIIGAKKGKDSKNHGIKFLSDLNAIIIDKKRTPNVASDFGMYEYEKNKEGNVILEYPKEPHASAATRYALNDIIIRNKMKFGGKR